MLKTKEIDTLFADITKQLKAKKSEFILIYSTAEKAQTLGFSNLDINFVNCNNLKLYKLAQAKYYIFTPEALNQITNRLETVYA